MYHTVKCSESWVSGTGLDWYLCIYTLNISVSTALTITLTLTPNPTYCQSEVPNMLIAKLMLIDHMPFKKKHPLSYGAYHLTQMWLDWGSKSIENKQWGLVSKGKWRDTTFTLHLLQLQPVARLLMEWKRTLRETADMTHWWFCFGNKADC